MTKTRRAFLASLTLATGIVAAGGALAQDSGSGTAVFAGGCFWCVESDYDHVEGVTQTISGFTGGEAPNPVYDEIDHKTTDHYEAVEVSYDPSTVDYETLVDAFWRSVDPTDAGGQFCDRGNSYRTAVFVTPEQRPIAEASKAAAQEELGQEIVTPILDRAEFWPVEEYHQNYYQKNPVQYNYYRLACGRNARVDQLWGDNSYLHMDG